MKNQRQTGSDAAVTKHIHLSHLFCCRTLCLISWLLIFSLLSLSCVSLSRPPSERCAPGLPTLIYVDYLITCSTLHSLTVCLGELQFQLQVVFSSSSLPLSYIPPLAFLTSPPITLHSRYWHHKLARIPAGISHEKSSDGVLQWPKVLH